MFCTCLFHHSCIPSATNRGKQIRQRRRKKSPAYHRCFYLGNLVFCASSGTGITVDGQHKQDVEKQFVVVPKKEQSSEKPAGQWNTYEISCLRDTIRCHVNGTFQNEASNATATAGWICLQSEGSPIEFRNIYIEPLN
jgi:hypothetical protein